MESTCTTRRLSCLALVFALIFSLLGGLSLEANAANTSYYAIVSNPYHLTSQKTEFQITGNRLSHKKVTISGELLYSAAGKSVTKWWAKNTEYRVWVYNKNGKLYSFKSNMKSGDKISLPTGKNKYTVVIMPHVTASYKEFKSACNGLVIGTYSYAQYRLKGV